MLPGSGRCRPGRCPLRAASLWLSFPTKRCARRAAPQANANALGADLSEQVKKHMKHFGIQLKNAQYDRGVVRAARKRVKRRQVAQGGAVRAELAVAQRVVLAAQDKRRDAAARVEVAAFGDLRVRLRAETATYSNKLDSELRQIYPSEVCAQPSASARPGG